MLGDQVDDLEKESLYEGLPLGDVHVTDNRSSVFGWFIRILIAQRHIRLSFGASKLPPYFWP